MLPYPLNLKEFGPIGEGAMLYPVLQDTVGEDLPDAGQLHQGFLIGRINIGRRQLEEFIQVFRDSLHPLGKGRFCIGFLP